MAQEMDNVTMSLGPSFDQFVIPYSPKDVIVNVSWAISMSNPPPVAVTWWQSLVVMARLWHQQLSMWCHRHCICHHSFYYNSTIVYFIK